MVRDRAALHVKDAEDRATLVERETIERVSRVDVENDTALASAREDAEGFVRKITLLEGELATKRRVLEGSEREHRERFEELTLLQTRGFELCHAMVGPPRGRHHLSDGMRHAALRHTEMAGELAVEEQRPCILLKILGMIARLLCLTRCCSGTRWEPNFCSTVISQSK
jgi:hypothetical protein